MKFFFFLLKIFPKYIALNFVLLKQAEKYRK